MSDQTSSPAAVAPLTPPPPVAAVAPKTALAMVQLTPDQTAKLDAQVAEFTQQLFALPVHADDFKTRVNALSAMGDAEIQRSASVSNRLLDRPVRAMGGGIFDAGSAVSKQLLDLRATVEKLNPRTHGDLLEPHKLLGFIPLGPQILSYFRSYESSQTHLNAIINGLYDSRDQLLRDDADIDQEKQNLWTLMGTLEQFAYLAQKVADAVQARVDGVAASDPERAKILKEDVLFYARQKQQDIATQQAVNVQGYLALDLVRKNNEELIKGVDRATTTTVAALRTAIIVAQALTNQKLVLDQIDALNSTTDHLIADTAAMLKENTGRVFEQATSSGVDLDTLKQAFADTESAIDGISAYKEKALVSFQQTVAALEPMIAQAKAYAARSRDAGASEVAELAPPPADGTARIVQ
ncbi:MAG TPA: toxic anion resistance protein [Candidatus Elarobacter sp.]|nr:toxic anion resistance protein [Candidatus Elarobacter sp.]